MSPQYDINIKNLRFFVLLFTLVFSLNLSARGDSKAIVIKLATLAPKGSSFHETLKDMAADWSEVSGGLVTLRIYAGGAAGDEGDMVRRLRIGQLHAALITINGLSRIIPEIGALNIPMAFDSWEMLDKVRIELSSEFEALLEKKDLSFLIGENAGWVRFFVDQPDPSIEEVKRAKLFVWAGDDKAVELWKSAGFNAIPLTAADILPGLQTGMINAYNTTAILSLANQWFSFTPYMIDLPWAPLVGATIIDKRVWEKIPEDLRPKLKEIANKRGQELRLEIRKMENEAIAEMEKLGLQVIKPNEDQLEQWRSTMISSYPKIRGEIIPAEWFDKTMETIEMVKQEISLNVK